MPSTPQGLFLALALSETFIQHHHLLQEAQSQMEKVRPGPNSSPVCASLGLWDWTVCTVRVPRSWPRAGVTAGIRKGRASWLPAAHLFLPALPHLTPPLLFLQPQAPWLLPGPGHSLTSVAQKTGFDWGPGSS